MTRSAIHSFILYTVQQVTTDRLQKAVCGLANGSLTVIVTRQSDTEIRALVRNGDSVEYGVTLTDALTTCSCKDALYRGVICKHAVATALHVLRTPQPKADVSLPARPLFHLMWQEGIVPCGMAQPEHVWVWPWTDYMVTWPEACPACVAAYRQPKRVIAA